MKRYVTWLLIFGLLCGLWGCKSDPGAGIYHGVYVQADDGVYLMEDYFNGENYLELEGDGDGLLHIHNTEHELSWKRDGEVLHFTEAGDSFEGRLSDGVIVMDYMNWGMVLTFAKEGASVPETTLGAEDDPAVWVETVAKMQEFWNGDWYGWWYISEGMGDYEASTGSWWDCAATIEIGSDARGSIVIWDEEHPKSAPLAESVLRIHEEGGGAMGIAMSGQGSFMGKPVLAGDWLIDPSVAPYENLVEINGYYDGGSGDGFFYVLYLRPWGQLWDDVREANNPNILPDVLPKHYEWYINALENNESLPETIG